MKMLASVFISCVCIATVLAISSPNDVHQKRSLDSVKKSNVHKVMKSAHNKQERSVESGKFETYGGISSDLVPIGGNYYFSGTAYVDFETASNICIESSLRLVSIPSQRANELLGRYLDQAGVNTNQHRIWSSGHRRADDPSKFVWEGINKPVEYTNWEGGQPNNASGEQDCIEIYQGHDNELIWNDIECAKLRSFVCQNV